LGLPVLRTLSLCTCCRHYPGAAAKRIDSLIHSAVSAFPERVVGSACALSFSRLTRRSLTLRPAHSRCHQFVTRIPKASASSLPPWLLRLLPAGAFAGWDLHPLESAALSRRTPQADIARAWQHSVVACLSAAAMDSHFRCRISAVALRPYSMAIRVPVAPFSNRLRWKLAS
jgi:hypothetical protein